MSSHLPLMQRRPHPVRSGRQVRAPIVACVKATNEIDHRSRLGLMPTPDDEPGLAGSSCARHVVELHAHRVSEKKIKFIGHPDFDDPVATAEILGPMPGPVVPGKRSRKVHAREGRALSDADSQGAKFLTREQEFHLFRKMNFLKYQAAQLQAAINPSRARSADIGRLEELLREADAVRNRIICSYLGLVVFVVKKWTGDCEDLFDLISDGNVTLIRASERFDFARGTRFSTYVTRAIINDFVRRIPRDRRRRVRFATGCEGLLQTLTDDGDSGRPEAMDQEPCREIIRKILGYLDERAQTIIVRRFGLSGDKQTLEQVGRGLGISKERVRQLESRALDMLRGLQLAQ
jgi:RNA polymerase primary sigma factor